jgi:hypothetical protein
MMRKIFFVAVLAVGLAACNAGAFLTQVRQGAIKACHFDPATSMIEAIIKATSGLDVTTIVGYVCRLLRLFRPPGSRLAAVPSLPVRLASC